MMNIITIIIYNNNDTNIMIQFTYNSVIAPVVVLLLVVFISNIIFVGTLTADINDSSGL